MFGSRTISRLATIGLGAILLFLTIFAVWAAATSRESADRAKRYGVVADAYRQAQYAMALELIGHQTVLAQLLPASTAETADDAHSGHADSAGHSHGAHDHGATSTEASAGGHDHGAAPAAGHSHTEAPAEGEATSSDHPGHAMDSGHDAAARQLIDAMNVVRQNGSALDRELANHILEHHNEHLKAFTRVFNAVQAGDADRALTLQRQELEPVFSHVQKKVAAAAAKHRTDSLAQLQALTRTEEVVFMGTLIAFAVGLLVLGAFVAVLRAAGRRLEEARQTEMERLEHAALTDNLTGLRNHRAFHEDLARELDRADRTGTPLGLVMIDLDGLKRVNDTQGHQAGDELIGAVAHGLQSTVRGGDVPYRIGGDEFAVILADESAWGAFRFAQRLHTNLALSSSPTTATVTAGIAESPGGAEHKDMLIRHADLALIQAKRTSQKALIYSDGLEPDESPIEREGDAERHHRLTLTTALARAVDAKDSYTRSHSETVSEMAALIAEEIGLDQEHVGKVRLAGLLHDVGKIGISDAILQKPAKLNDREFAVMKTHSTLGHSIVSAAELYEEAEWIRHHHERLDGRGYPDGLAGEAVPIESRIILVADAFEAMTSDRPYRPGRPEADALEELERHAGSQFDPDCVAALRRALSTKTTSAIPAESVNSEYEAA
jgi:diguanylate cyclase (GGDEF)-like protein/putative nucleotidyltransferase with HDIG domain